MRVQSRQWIELIVISMQVQSRQWIELIVISMQVQSRQWIELIVISMQVQSRQWIELIVISMQSCGKLSRPRLCLRCADPATLHTLTKSSRGVGLFAHHRVKHNRQRAPCHRDHVTKLLTTLSFHPSSCACQTHSQRRGAGAVSLSNVGISGVSASSCLYETAPRFTAFTSVTSVVVTACVTVA
ncbi:hypothetical protein BaRGS_00030824 [Batillaria attramentaria]|uniref:Secreted protein n=1 Tax=Batillaria attramentaria TaxID=370345 RepID=A0ABD0JTB3_9CAEN